MSDHETMATSRRGNSHDRVRRLLRDLRSYARRWRQRCDHCGRRGRWREAWHSSGNRDGKVWHGPCMSYRHWRSKADERLAVLALVSDAYDINPRDVEVVAELRSDEFETGQRNRAWRVFYDLKHYQESQEALDG